MSHPVYTITDQGLLESPGSVTGERQDPLGPADSVGSSSASHAGAAGIDVGKPDDSRKTETELFEAMQRADRALRIAELNFESAAAELKRHRRVFRDRAFRYANFTRACASELTHCEECGGTLVLDHWNVVKCAACGEAAALL